MDNEDYILGYEARRKSGLRGDPKVVAEDLKHMEAGQRCIVSRFLVHENYDEEEVFELGRRLKKHLNGSGENYRVLKVNLKRQGIELDYLVAVRDR
tara:strand:+ start:639 stop:926 length:288 start_codon:yes stop_codon:yes gene_type:complete